MDSNLIFGIRPVAEAIEAGKQIEKLYIRKGAEGQLMQELKDLCMRHRLHYQEVPVEKLNRLTRGNHQGVVAQTAAIEYVQLTDILERVPEDETPLVVLFDGVTDVRNFGAIARSAECVGASGIVIPNKRAARVTAATYKSSAGAISHIPVTQVANLVSTIERLKDEGFWVAAATEHASDLIWQSNLKGKIALVMGNEGEGVSRLVLENCDFGVKLPQVGEISSLNVAQASTACMYEWLRQNWE